MEFITEEAVDSVVESFKETAAAGVDKNVAKSLSLIESKSPGSMATDLCDMLLIDDNSVETVKGLLKILDAILVNKYNITKVSS